MDTVYQRIHFTCHSHNVANPLPSPFFQSLLIVLSDNNSYRDKMCHKIKLTK